MCNAWGNFAVHSANIRAVANATPWKKKVETSNTTCEQIITTENTMAIEQQHCLARNKVLCSHKYVKPNNLHHFWNHRDGESTAIPL